jgi:hypothetical protein
MTVELQVSAPRDRAFYLAYQIMPMVGVETVFLSPAVPLHNISVPAGKSLRILSKPEGQMADITIEGVVFHNEPLGERMFSGGVLEGPAELTVLHMDHLWTYTLSYTVQDAAVVTPPPGVISAEGLHAVTVEHSSDATDWSPAAIILNTGDPQSFYRLKAPE